MLIKNLTFLYHIIVASENLLRVAADYADKTLRIYLENHLQEERGHAKWLAEDLLSVGVNVTSTQPPTLAMQLVGSIYYLIFHASPVALLGYMRVLEDSPLTPEQFENMGQHHPASLLRTVRYHAEHDPAHLSDLLAVIEKQTPEHRALIASVAAMTREYLRQATVTFEATV